MLQVELLAVGTKAPSWVEQGLEEYVPRMKGLCKFTIRETKTADRKKPNSVTGYQEDESKSLLSGIVPGAKVIAMDSKGTEWSTEQLAKKINQWSLETNHFQFLIGGPDGLADACRSEADHVWSLSKLTFPHFMVRVLLAEQIYRAFMVNANHPYHK